MNVILKIPCKIVDDQEVGSFNICPSHVGRVKFTQKICKTFKFKVVLSRIELVNCLNRALTFNEIIYPVLVFRSIFIPHYCIGTTKS